MTLFYVDSGTNLEGGPVEQTSGSAKVFLSFEMTVAKLEMGGCPNERAWDQRLPMMGEYGK